MVAKDTGSQWKFERPRLTPAGMVVMWAGAALLAVGVARYDGALIWLGAAALGTLALARWWAPINARGLVVSRRRPRRVFAGEIFSVTLRVSRGGGGHRKLAFLPRAGCGVEIRDKLLPERVRGLWVKGLKSGEVEEGKLPVRLFRRGREARVGVELASSFPLGLFEVAARGRLHDETLAADGGLIVYPRPLLPEALRRELELARFDLSFPHGTEPEPGEEFRGVRAYQSGDPVKAIHWPATAREGTLMVREWDPPTPRPRRYGMVFHALERRARLLRPERWETALRVATGLVTHCREEGVALWFVDETRGGEAGWLRMPEKMRFDSALEHLALARRVTLKEPGRLDCDLRHLGESCDRIFVISDVPLSQWRGRIELSGVACPVICLDTETVEPVRPKKMSLPVLLKGKSGVVARTRERTAT